MFSGGSYGRHVEYMSKGFGWGGVLRGLDFDSKMIRKSLITVSEVEISRSFKKIIFNNIY